MARAAARRRSRAVQVGRVAVQSADRQTLVEIAAAALPLAQTRADAPERTRQRQPVRDHFHRAAMVPRRDAIDEPRNIEPGRALGRARRDALSGVIGEQKLQRHLARRADVLAVGETTMPSATGMAQAGESVRRPSICTAQTKHDAAGSIPGHVAHGRDADAQPLGRLQHGGPRLYA